MNAQTPAQTNARALRRSASDIKFQFYAEDHVRFTGDRKLDQVRELNPALQSFADCWPGVAVDQAFAERPVGLRELDAYVLDPTAEPVEFLPVIASHRV